MKLQNNRYVQILFIGTLVFGLYGCDNKSNTQGANHAQEMPPLPVKAIKVEFKDIELDKSYPALIKPYEEAQIIARVQGVLEKQHFVEGSYVKKGELLYTIEHDVYQAKLDVANANFNKALSDYERAKKLYATKSISDKEYETFVASYENTKANLKLAQIEYDYATIKAPISGVVGIKSHDIGNFVATNTKLTTITSTNPIHLEFSIPKSDANRFLSQFKDSSTNIKLVDSTNKESVHNGLIDYIAPQIDINTNTLSLRAKFENKSQEYIIGDFVKVSVKGLKINNAITIPEEAIFQTQNGAIVYVVDDGMAKPRPVILDILTSEGMVLKGGLNDGDMVIINNIAKVRPNSKVKIMDGN
ncbi:efflux RND transporter periplasmic adaptor subunit [Arcobacter sp. FWKO B]|uniref:efflux RND transporter periplasmic adaptor subunit n=1 Tax=Arcobacter sp. FWKO B TaxID=2593672 RepID=UPI0018A625EA|nr:efflux RND transporter periplasmic adaptor subunit [Arcobacter sp. FWKO B]QOG13131.1 efflux RND transporter periplasmic adaptor subunit [Arcobacter sp. FWKO B]